MHGKVVSFLQDRFMEDSLEWNEFSRDHAQVGSLSNAALVRIYWFAQGQRESWVGLRLPKHLNNKKVQIVSCRCFSVFCVAFFFFLTVIVSGSPQGHVLDVLGVTEDWYRDCSETPLPLPAAHD